MTRTWLIWTVFGCAIGVVLAVMVWVSATVWRLDRLQRTLRRQEIETQRRLAWEDNLRLALWRIDTLAAPLIARETARPYFVYRTFLPASGVYNRMFNVLSHEEAMWAQVASPLTLGDSPHVRLHFQIEPDGQFTSPQVFGDASNAGSALSFGPLRPEREAAILRGLARQLNRESMLERLASLGAGEDIVTSPTFWQERGDLEPPPALAEPETRPAAAGSPSDTQSALPRAAAPAETYVGKGRYEYDQRQQFAQQQTWGAVNNAEVLGRNFFTNNMIPQQAIAVPLGELQDSWTSEAYGPPTGQQGTPPATFAPVTTSIMAPMWLGDDLVLLRRVEVGGETYIQGCLLDWPSLRTQLLAAVADLLPSAQLEPIRLAELREPCHRLATLPVLLQPGPLPPASEGLLVDRSIPVLLSSLAVAWCSVLTAVLAVGVLVEGVIRLGRRRSAFVTAVTHELRTPLTTFQMYADMLAEGMVPDADQQKIYFNTLRAEATRLTHMVENVLAYARLHRGRGLQNVEAISLADLLEAVAPQMAARAARDGMRLVVATDPASDAFTLRASISAVDQILFNLVDNACKYAAGGGERRIDLTATIENHQARIAVRDYGPGVHPAVRNRLFRPFAKSAHEAAESKPGVGLGLALSRQLARAMQGDVLFEPTADGGTRFLLCLPRRRESPPQS